MIVAPALARPVALAALSPDGRLVAMVGHRTATNDLAARERVHVHEVSTGERVFSLDGPDVVRTIAWASPERLLVARDGRGRASTLTLHEAPDGGAVGRYDAPHLAQHRPRVTFSRDGQRALVAPPDAADCKRPEHEVARVLALPSLDLVGEVDCAAVGRALGLGLLARASLTLHPDGHVLAATDDGGWRATGETAVVVVPVARVAEARVVARAAGYGRTMLWVGPRTLAIRLGRPLAALSTYSPTTRDSALAVAECDGALAEASVRTVLGGGDGPWVEPLAAHPDGDLVLAGVGRRGPRLGDPQPGSPRGDALIRYAEAIRCSTGERLDLGEIYGRPACVVWGDVGRMVVALMRGSPGIALKLAECATGQLRRYEIIRKDRPTPEEIQTGGRRAMVTLQDRTGALSLAFADLSLGAPCP